jgi:hypothetical protein
VTLRLFEPRPVIETLVRHGVRFIMIGGLAARLRGSPSITDDMDICYARDDQNLERLAAALQELGARLRGAPDDVPFILDARTLKAGDHFTFSTRAGPLDCLGTPAGTAGFEDLERNAEPMEIGGSLMLVASIDDLITMKLTAGRPKDLIEAEILGALRKELDERGDL